MPYFIYRHKLRFSPCIYFSSYLDKIRYRRGPQTFLCACECSENQRGQAITLLLHGAYNYIDTYVLQSTNWLPQLAVILMRL